MKAFDSASISFISFAELNAREFVIRMKSVLNSSSSDMYKVGCFTTFSKQSDFPSWITINSLKIGFIDMFHW